MREVRGPRRPLRHGCVPWRGPQRHGWSGGKLYLNHTKYWTTEWRKNEAENISRADKNWRTVQNQPEPEK